MRQNELKHLLPEIYRRTIDSGGPLQAFLDVMEELHAPSEEILAQLEEYFDPYRTPDRFVPFLAACVDLDRLLPESAENTREHPQFPSGLGRLRELIAAAAFLSKWRGTRKGLITFLETATGAEGFAIRENTTRTGEERPFHLDVRAPAAAERYRELVEQIVQMEKPAYVTYELQFEERK